MEKPRRRPRNFVESIDEHFDKVTKALKILSRADDLLSEVSPEEDESDASEGDQEDSDD